ncbi:MAG: NADP-dependent malic enzyme [Chitinivibrionia bacterium]|nr:NADP-dependent malic enzyme [Chitinivibrionia bacterium]
MSLEKEALEYHMKGRKGKIEVKPSKPCSTQHDLSLAYTPGVAEPCRKIEKNPNDVFKYTARGNLVAVVSNGTAVLGLGDIGPLASKPVMEGKGVLFKRFADVDVFDIEVDSKDPDDVIRVVKLLEPTFGGINLEDIKAPECFYIEETLKKTMSIPVFHDDQHGTAIISGAGFLNALEIVGKKIGDVVAVFNGAGAAGIACAKMYLSLGMKKEHIILCDSKGVIYKGRTEGMNKYKQEFAIDTPLRTLEEAMKGADAFVGVSVADTLTPEMVKSMAAKPIIFAMANPDPEIKYDLARQARPDAIIATGRSDYPNQVNNVLGFPFIFRGALDVQATAINEAMKIAAVRALAELTKEDVPDSVRRAYGVESISFGPDYIIPKPFDPRVLIWEATAVAKAAIDSGVARIKLDIDEYKSHLAGLMSKSEEIMTLLAARAAKRPRTVVFPEGSHEKIIRASKILSDEKMAKPVLLGNRIAIEKASKKIGISLNGIEIIEPASYSKFDEYCEQFYTLRCRKGVTTVGAKELMSNSDYFGCMMVHRGDADCLISGVTRSFPMSIRPPLQIIGTKQGKRRVAATHIMMLKDQLFFFADTSVNIEPTEEDLAEIALLTADVARSLQIPPRVAMLSFSNFGSVDHHLARKVSGAVKLVREKDPTLTIDGEMQAETALRPELQTEFFKCTTLQGKANVLIFPDLQSANIGYKLIQTIAGAEIIGPILMGMKKPVHILIRSSEVRDVVNMAVFASIQAIEMEDKAAKK